MATTQTCDSPIRIHHSRQATLHTAPGVEIHYGVSAPQAFAQAKTGETGFRQNEFCPEP